ncbi:myosin-2-like [Ctenocephalides felis]|uniref:myosin-2-like n=1 Tax=Ctenocephalides felis TaxID=7515 RepID=UPI000E6E172C|nr:myosin-2-like [Ctenocephalides felis]
MHRDDSMILNHPSEGFDNHISGTSSFIESEQASNLITAAGNKYNALKNCLNSIKDTLTKGGESLSPQLLNLSSFSSTLGLTDDMPHETLQYARRAHLSSLNSNYAQNLLATGEPQQQIFGSSSKELAEIQKQLDESRDEIKSLVSSKRDTLDVFKQLREKYDALRMSRKTALEQLAILKHQNSELHERFENEKKLREKEYKETVGLRRALDSLRSTSDHLKRSNESLLRQLRGSHVDVEELRASVEETKERLKCSEHQLLLCDAEIKRRDASRHEILKQNTQYVELQRKCEELEAALQQAGQADDERCRQMEQEIIRLKTTASENQKLFERERKESNEILQDLNASIVTHKEKIKELSGIVIKQDALIQEQLQAIESQEKQIKEIQHTSENAKKRAEYLEEKLSEAEEEFKEALVPSEAATQLKETRQELENTRDALLIKDKIIEDQVGTIQNLKTTLNEKSNELQKLSMQRDREKSKYKLALGELQTRKPVSGNLIQQRQKMGWQEDEQRAACKQLLLMRREKDHAVFTAHYVTKQLIQTVSEFENQVATQKKVHRMLISVLGEKEKNAE